MGAFLLELLQRSFLASEEEAALVALPSQASEEAEEEEALCLLVRVFEEVNSQGESASFEGSNGELVIETWDVLGRDSSM